MLAVYSEFAGNLIAKYSLTIQSSLQILGKREIEFFLNRITMTTLGMRQNCMNGMSRLLE